MAAWAERELGVSFKEAVNRAIRSGLGEADNHVIELAVAGAADAVVTRNTRDFEGAELRLSLNNK